MERILSSLFFLYLGFEILFFIFFFGLLEKRSKIPFRAKRKISVKIPLSTTKRERALVFRLDHRYRRHEEEEETSVVVFFVVVFFVVVSESKSGLSSRHPLQRVVGGVAGCTPRRLVQEGKKQRRPRE